MEKFGFSHYGLIGRHIIEQNAHCIGGAITDLIRSSLRVGRGLFKAYCEALCFDDLNDLVIS